MKVFSITYQQPPRRSDQDRQSAQVHLKGEIKLTYSTSAIFAGGPQGSLSEQTLEKRRERWLSSRVASGTVVGLRSFSAGGWEVGCRARLSERVNPNTIPLMVIY